MKVAVRKAGARLRPVPVWDGPTQLIVLGLCFAAGTLGGFFFSCWGGSNPELSDYLRQYFQMIGREEAVVPPLWSSIWDLTRWLFGAFLLGSTALGAVGIPLLMGVRGFLLSYSAATFARLFGLPGMAVSVASFGLAALVAVPVLFVVASDAFRQSLGRLSGERPPGWRQRVQALAPCAGLIVLAVALQQTVMPVFLTAVCASLFVT